MNNLNSQRLIDKYPAAWTDFHPFHTPCIYKSGDPWVSQDGTFPIIRECHTICRPDIEPVWVSTLLQIAGYLTLVGIKYTSIDPFAWANQGDDKPFCDFLLTIGVVPESLAFGLAVVTANGVKSILDMAAGLTEVEVAFIETTVHRLSSVPSPGPGPAQPPSLLSVDTLNDIDPQYRKPFSALLGLSVAPQKSPYREGTGAVFFELGGDGPHDSGLALLTCAHVLPPPRVLPNHHPNMMHTDDGEGRLNESMIALSSNGYRRAIAKIREDIDMCALSIEKFNQLLENPKLLSKTRARHECEITKCREQIVALNELHTEVTTRRATTHSRVLGRVLHASTIRPQGPFNYTEDWGLIKIDPAMIDQASFAGNKLFIGDKYSPATFDTLMFPQNDYGDTYKLQCDSLLPAWGAVTADEITQQGNRDANDRLCLFVVKNGGRTGTTLGRANGLVSVKRTYDELGRAEQDSLEVAVISYPNDHGTYAERFSDKGDSGAIVLTREGKILGMINGGRGSSDGTDVTYVTPWWWLVQRIRARYPNVQLWSSSPEAGSTSAN